MYIYPRIDLGLFFGFMSIISFIYCKRYIKNHNNYIDLNSKLMIFGVILLFCAFIFTIPFPRYVCDESFGIRDFISAPYDKYSEKQKLEFCEYVVDHCFVCGYCGNKISYEALIYMKSLPMTEQLDKLIAEFKEDLRARKIANSVDDAASTNISTSMLLPLILLSK